MDSGVVRSTLGGRRVGTGPVSPLFMPKDTLSARKGGSSRPYKSRTSARVGQR